MKAVKKAIAVIFEIIVILVLILSIAIIFAGITRAKTGVPSFLGFTSASVETDSMEPAINIGDVVVGRVPREGEELEVGDIVSYYKVVSGHTITITHRISDKFVVDGITYYETWGDNRESCPAPDEKHIVLGDIASVYKFKLAGVGKFIEFLRKPIGFIICLVLPLAAFIIWQTYDLITLIVKRKKSEMIAEVSEQTSEEVKEAIIREYLAKNAAESGSSPDADENK